MDNQRQSGSDLVYLVLEETLPMIHTALVSYYGFSDSEAETFKDTLAIWFHRVGRRANGQLPSCSDLREQLAFPEIDYDKVDRLRGLEISIVTTAKTDEESKKLLELLGMPFAS